MTLFPIDGRWLRSVTRVAAVGGLAVSLSAASPTLAPSERVDRPAGRGAVMHILPIGDSITQGGGSGRKEYSYRYPLLRMLEDEQACFDFVGSRAGGLDPRARWPDGGGTGHEGYYGATTAQVRDRLAHTLAGLPPPDIALVHLGTNDARSAFGSDTIEPLGDIVRLLRERNPRVVVLIALVKMSRAKSAIVHLRVRVLAGEMSTAESPVVAVDQYSSWDANPSSARADTFDGVHPNLRGQRRMAENWLAALRAYLPPARC